MASSEFARRQLTKHGWKEGSGLGKTESGISEAIKVKLKTDNAGVGVDPGEQFTYHWWDHVFNKAASNITVENNKDGVKVKSQSDRKTPISTKKVTKTYDSKKMLYGTFVKSTTLTWEGVQGEDSENEDDTSSDSDSNDDDNDNKYDVPSDEQLFKACGGLTAHKAARHGHKLNGKLKRIEEQEKLLLMKRTMMSEDSKSGDMEQETTNRKMKKKKEKIENTDTQNSSQNLERTSDVDHGRTFQGKQKNKKKRKFSELSDGDRNSDLNKTKIVDENSECKEKKRKSKKRSKKLKTEQTGVAESDLTDRNNDVRKKKKKKKKKM
ncbi:G patch domain-containing protein 4-like [Glandiceps talaboti]